MLKCPNFSVPCCLFSSRTRQHWRASIILVHILVCYSAHLHSLTHTSTIYCSECSFQLMHGLGPSRGQGQGAGRLVKGLPHGLSNHDCYSTGQGTKGRALSSSRYVHPKLQFKFMYGKNSALLNQQTFLFGRIQNTYDLWPRPHTKPRN